MFVKTFFTSFLVFREQVRGNWGSWKRVKMFWSIRPDTTSRNWGTHASRITRDVTHHAWRHKTVTQRLNYRINDWLVAFIENCNDITGAAMTPRELQWRHDICNDVTRVTLSCRFPTGEASRWNKAHVAVLKCVAHKWMAWNFMLLY